MLNKIIKLIKEHKTVSVHHVVRVTGATRLVLLSQDKILHVDLMGNILVVLLMDRATGTLLLSNSDVVDYTAEDIMDLTRENYND